MDSPFKKDRVPKSEREDFKTKTFLISTLHSLSVGETTINDIPALESVDEKEFKTTFTQKCKECSKLCDFSSDKKEKEAKTKKSEYLTEFEKVFTKPRFFRNIDQDLIKEFCTMVRKNIARSMTEMKYVSSIDCPDNVQDVSWPHLSLVYRALIGLFSSKLASNVKDESLGVILISNTYSSDDRERQSCKDCVSMMFEKVPDMKPMLIKATINQIRLGYCSGDLLNFVYDIVPEMKKLFSSEFSNYFHTVLKLHNHVLYMKFSGNLTQCVTRFIRTDQSLLVQAIMFLAKHWPTYNIKKQVIFSGELESIMQNFGEDAVDGTTAQILFEKMATLINQPGVDISEAALSFVIGQGNENNLIKNINIAIPLMLPSLLACYNHHWNVFIRDDAKIVLDLLSKVNPSLFSQEAAKFKTERKQKKALKDKWQKNWKIIFEIAQSHDAAIQGPQIYTSTS